MLDRLRELVKESDQLTYEEKQLIMNLVWALEQIDEPTRNEYLERLFSSLDDENGRFMIEVRRALHELEEYSTRTERP